MPAGTTTGIQTGNVRDLADAIRTSKNAARDGVAPITFLVGAGCSVSAGVPLAADIARKLIVEAVKDCGAKADALASELDAYNWMQKHRQEKIPGCIKPATDEKDIDWSRVCDGLFGSHYAASDHQRRIFGELTNPTQIGLNWSHLCLGELIRTGYVSTLLTTNFDQLALEGMIAAGVLPVICDGFESLNRIVPNPSAPQLVHIHGSRHTYRLRNSPGDVAEGATDARVTGSLSALLQGSSVFVAVGYGGREEGFMGALMAAGKQYTDKALYWVMHSSNPSDISDRAKSFLETSKSARVVVGMDADDFFVELMRELSLEAPLMIRDPLSYATAQSERLGRAQLGNAAANALRNTFRFEIEDLRNSLNKARKTRGKVEAAVHEAQSDFLSGRGVRAFQALYPYLSKLKESEATELLAGILAKHVTELDRPRADKALKHLLQLDEDQ